MKQIQQMFRKYKTSTGTFKLTEGKKDLTIFLPLNENIGGQITSPKNKYNENKYLTEDQTRYIYKKVESGNIINIKTLKQEIAQDQELNKLDDTSRDINPYRELIVNNAEKIDSFITDETVVNTQQCIQLHTLQQTPKKVSII